MSNQQQYIPVAKPVGKQHGSSYAPLAEEGKLHQGAWGESEYLVEAEKSMRLGFVRKVYGLVMIMLGVTAATSAVFVLNNSVREAVIHSDAILWSSYGVFIVTLFSLICCSKLRRQHPHGMIALTIFTLASSYFVGTICALYAHVIGPYVVLEALLMTILMVTGLTVFAFQTKYDFTRINCFAIVLGMMLFNLCIFQFVFVFPSMPFWRNMYAVMGAGLMCFFIVYDTQLMLGGKHKYNLSVDEHIFAALNLYLDIINLFLYLLQLLSGGKRN
jgi:FtsH-binding integral membrane protein